MRYGLLLHDGFLPWDKPLDQGPLRVDASVHRVTLFLGEQPLLQLEQEENESLSGGEGFTGLLQVASRCSESINTEEVLRVGSGRVLRIFSSAELAEDWLKQGQEQKQGWEFSLRLLLAQG